MAETDSYESPSEHDSLFGPSRRESTQADGPVAPSNNMTGLVQPISSTLVPGNIDHEPTEEEISRNKGKFEVELEFIQCLASPNYLHELATQGYLEDPAFLNFLEYLEYWREPDFAQHIMCVLAFGVTLSNMSEAFDVAEGADVPSLPERRCDRGRAAQPRDLALGNMVSALLDPYYNMTQADDAALPSHYFRREGESTRINREQHTREALERQQVEAEEAERIRRERSEQEKQEKQ
ncbi:hypothetical protein QFC19_000155 [Naganishia cerealis]|uniref:Uncharacterized protein n=1 Tax=Naganishia cerealis TaxID=610337 RepID=A0ACC2WRZ7_9TREE|nr:hypothetical protein QFC19_000155 [Naganishia cerealis]